MSAGSTRPRRQRLELLVVLLGAFGVVIACAAVAPAFTWNLSPSLPRGLYVLGGGAPSARGSIVSFRPPPGAARLMAARSYLPSRASLLKIVVGLPGDDVRVDAAGVSINGRSFGPVPAADRRGRPLAPFVLSRHLLAGEAF